MTRKIYRTAQGKMVDLGALQLQNETVRAVGNMNVNARGDLVDSQNRPIDSRSQQVSKQYRKQTSNVTDSSVVKKKDTPLAADKLKTKNDIEPNSTPAVEEPSSGLAAAIARARQVKQEPLTPAQNTSNQPTGISKI